MSSLGNNIEGADCVSVTSSSNNNTSTSNVLPVGTGMLVAAGGITIFSGSSSSGHISRLTRSIPTQYCSDSLVSAPMQLSSLLVKTLHKSETSRQSLKFADSVGCVTECDEISLHDNVDNKVDDNVSKCGDGIDLVNNNVAAEFYHSHILLGDKMVEVSNAFTSSQRSAIGVLEFLDKKRSDDDSASCDSNKSNSSHASGNKSSSSHVSDASCEFIAGKNNVCAKVSGHKQQFDEMLIDFISNTDDVVEQFEGMHENNDEHYHETEFALQIPEELENPLAINVPVQNSPDVCAISATSVYMDMPEH
eukprot:15366253-Ditylum_brightwellii.AAC.1